MAVYINILYTGDNGNARAFVDEMKNTGVVEAIRAEDGNICYEYYQPLEDPESILSVVLQKFYRVLF